MNRKSAMSVVLIASTMLMPTASALAQSVDPESRFEAAQRRFDGELAIFKMEVERYERARAIAARPAAAPAPVLPPVVAEAPRPVAADAAHDLEDEPRAVAADPAERDETDGQPPL